MKTIRHIPIVLLFLVLAMAVQAQDPSVTIAFDSQKNPPTVSLVEGEGTLYHYSKEPGKYRGVYYLFTDAHVVKIDPKSKLAKNRNLAFDMNDGKSNWLKNDTISKGNDILVSKSTLDKWNSTSFKWEERAHLLISTTDSVHYSNEHTLLLVVLPMPPQDTIITKIDKDITVDKDSCMINGIVTIHRTGRIKIDSVYVEGRKAHTTFHNGGHDHDTPYYRTEGFANVKIQCPWDQESRDLDLVVYFTRFNDNGTMDHSHIDYSVNLFEKSFFSKYWWAIVVVIIAALSILALVILLIRRNSNAGPSSGDSGKLLKEIERLKKERRLLEDKADREEKMRQDCEQHLVKELEQKEKEISKLMKDKNCIEHEYKCRLENQLAKKEVEIKKLMSSQENTKREEFVQKCEELINEIEKVRADYKGNASLDALDEKLRTLERIIIIKKQ